MQGLITNQNQLFGLPNTPPLDNHLMKTGGSPATTLLFQGTPFLINNNGVNSPLQMTATLGDGS
jgi:hypothetical protein